MINYCPKHVASLTNEELKALGTEDALMELHGRKTPKKRVYKEVEGANTGHPIAKREWSIGREIYRLPIKKQGGENNEALNNKTQKTCQDPRVEMLKSKGLLHGEEKLG